VTCRLGSAQRNSVIAAVQRRLSFDTVDVQRRRTHINRPLLVHGLCTCQLRLRSAGARVAQWSAELFQGNAAAEIGL
jgi:hypothetical protein